MSSGRDPRRRPTAEDRRLAYVLADGRCQNCGNDLGPDYHNAHMAAWSNGGPSTGENIRAECPNCNLKLGPRDAEQVEGLHLRQWQAEALPIILRQLWITGVATLHAAPGAGKTLFAGVVFQKLRDAGLVQRLIIVVPNLAIVDQWKTALGRLRIHLDTEPRDGFLEHPDTAGAVITYHLLPRVAANHAVRLDKIPTLVILDEVHHVAESATWGTSVRRMIGDVANGTVQPAGVLNMTGTLFRSSRAKRISTVRYDRIATDEGEKLQAVADWSIGTADLIGVELRSPDLYAYGAHAQLVDLREEHVISGEIADLDHQQVSAVIRNMLTSKGWVQGYAAEALRMLRNQLQALEGEEPLKLLFVANGRKEARLAADAINAVADQDFARLVISDEPQALRTLRRAVREPYPCAIVAVKMVTEGFDCPQVSTIAYATNVIADLFVAQTMARAMRITDTERANGRMLPAQILIPDHSEIRRAFAGALAGALHLITDDDDESGPGEGPGAGLPRLPRYDLLDLSDPRLDSATVLDQEDGQVPADQLQWGVATLRDLNVPEVYAPRFVLGARRYRPPVRTYAPPTEPAGTAARSGVTVTELDPRSLNRVHRARLQQSAGWMQKHVDHDARYRDVGVFQALANEAASIPSGERDQALSGQLAEAAQWMTARIVEHCHTHQEPVPSWARGEDA